MVMRIRELRDRAGMTQDELAASVGVVRSAVANWEVEISLPKARQLPLLAEVLECSIDELFVQSDREQPEEVCGGQMERQHVRTVHCPKPQKDSAVILAELSNAMYSMAGLMMSLCQAEKARG